MPLLLFLAFLIGPIVEIYVIIQVGGLIGAWPTVALLLAESVLGAWIVKREGRRAWRALQGTLAVGEMPNRELADAALVLIGGVLLLTPGFVTDFMGFFFVLPFTRPFVRGALTALAARRLRARAERVARLSGHQGAPEWGAPHRVVHGQVVDD